MVRSLHIGGGADMILTYSRYCMYVHNHQPRKVRLAPSHHDGSQRSDVQYYPLGAIPAVKEAKSRWTISLASSSAKGEDERKKGETL